MLSAAKGLSVRKINLALSFSRNSLPRAALIGTSLFGGEGAQLEADVLEASAIPFALGAQLPPIDGGFDRDDCATFPAFDAFIIPIEIVGVDPHGCVASAANKAAASGAHVFCATTPGAKVAVGACIYCAQHSHSFAVFAFVHGVVS